MSDQKILATKTKCPIRNFGKIISTALTLVRVKTQNFMFVTGVGVT